MKDWNRLRQKKIRKGTPSGGIELSIQHHERERFLKQFVGPNAGYAIELYEKFKMDPSLVDEPTRKLLEQYAADIVDFIEQENSVISSLEFKGKESPDPTQIIVKAVRLARNIREFGHLQARFDPLEETPHRLVDDPEVHGLQDNDLVALPASVVSRPNARVFPGNCLDAMNRLRQIYSGSIGYDFSHVHNFEERDFLRDTVEMGTFSAPLSVEERRSLLMRLTEVEQFERFLHTTFVGQKRFSIEGTDVLVPMLDELVHRAARSKSHEVLMGMAHRGRLSVLSHVLGKPYEAIFSEFHTAANKDIVPSEGSRGINFGWTGDVKYHLGRHRFIKENDVVGVRVTLAHNPSHLEFVNPVIEGYTRAAQDDLLAPGPSQQTIDRALAVIIHGDAAFPGEGVVAETLNLSRLRAYQVGGTLHIILNNGLGFTTEPQDGRSTLYASDLAKGFEIPIVHVNADDPEACLSVIRLAFEYRRRFHKDFLIDLVGYRRWGHNEGDEPQFTQPLRYQKISAHSTVRSLYAQQLVAEKVVTAAMVQQMEEQAHSRLRAAKAKIDNGTHVVDDQDDPSWEDGLSKITHQTQVSVGQLERLNHGLLRYPAGFNIHPKLARQLERRGKAIGTEKGIDWGHAESLAYASILAEGVPIRLTGQDVERGTFSQRHLVLHDLNQNRSYTPLQHLPEARASFSVFNSPLSEAAVIGFEYGYSVEAPRALVIWEAQFGDFANAGQVLFDQFIAPGRAKWKQYSGLVILLPHGYEGQGPEHSSGRVERFLQLAGDENMRVVNCSTAAQYFHLLREQAEMLKIGPRPLIVMTPKSLLRNPAAFADIDELSKGNFHTVLDDPERDTSKDQVRRVVICSGKIAVDLFASRHRDEAKTAIIRIEQLYPFPADDLTRVLDTYPGIEEIIWVQEEPRNMGPWHFVQSQWLNVMKDFALPQYLGRAERASTAEGVAEMHAQEQSRIITKALAVDQAMRLKQGGRLRV